MLKNIKRDCKYYDWGRTAPREYGAFCEIKKTLLQDNICKNCKDYNKKEE